MDPGLTCAVLLVMGAVALVGSLVLHLVDPRLLRDVPLRKVASR